MSDEETVKRIAMMKGKGQQFLVVCKCLIQEPLAAFAFTESNLGSNPKALAEAATWSQETGKQWLKPALKAQHWLRKLWAGAYLPKTLSVSIYLPGSPERTSYSNISLSHKWPYVD